MLIPTLLLALQTSITVGTDGVRADRGDPNDRPKREVRRIAVTEEHRRTAFKDGRARELLLRAREARLAQDSLLVSYDAKSYDRVSVGMSLRETSRARLAFRAENATRVRWHRASGAHVEVLGRREAVPFSREMEREVENEMGNIAGIPYYPGKEPLWVGSEMARSEVDEREFVHPLAEGSEAYYLYQSGDSIVMTLPDRSRITLRELRITSRTPMWNAAVGSFWFEADKGHLVRAVYRLSTQMDIWAVAQADDSTNMDDVPFWVKPMISPMTADITAISIEYGLHEQRFWLPKLQGMDGHVRVGFMRIPVRMEQRYRYESVNGLDPLPAIDVPVRATWTEHRDSLIKAGIDTAVVDDSMRVFSTRRDSLEKAERVAQCAAGTTWMHLERRYEGSLPVAIATPCDTEKLKTSAELPRSIYDEGDELFGRSERDELVKSLTMGLQPAWGPQAPRLEWGLRYTRFNRIEGFSTGATLTSTLGKGYTVTLGGRGSIADGQVNGDLSIARSNGRSDWRLTAFRRLAVSSDFGDPLSLGTSAAVLVGARDEGFYHRAWGAEIAGTRPMRGTLDWRLFAEEQFTATVENRWSLAGTRDVASIPNVTAVQGWYEGAALRWRGSRGLDPRGWRAAGDVRAEAATGESDYARALFESTLSRGFGPLAVSITGAAGTSGGSLPPQRHFFLGGLQTVRGQDAGTGFGEAFWLGRVEVGANRYDVRPLIFGDLGWAGPRDGWGEVGRPLSGVGVGASFLDGMIRADVARGIHPKWQTRFNLSLEARF